LAGDVNFENPRLGLLRRMDCKFVPAAVEVASSGSTVRRQRNVPPCKAEPGAGTIEVEIDGVTIRVGRGADAKTLMTVLRALKAGA